MAISAYSANVIYCFHFSFNLLIWVCFFSSYAHNLNPIRLGSDKTENDLVLGTYLL